MACLSKVPFELWLAVLNEWIGDLKSLSNLDVAGCSRAFRPDILALLTGCRLRNGFTFSSDERIISFVMWIGSRRVQLPNLELGVHRIPELAAFSASSAFPSISSLQLKEYEEYPGYIEKEEMERFASCFPSLTALDCSAWHSFADPHLLALSNCPLIAYTLEHCDLVSPACLADVLLARRVALVKLDCGVLDENALSLLAGQFPLRHLGFDCDHLSSHAIASFCSSFPALHYLRLGMLYEGAPCPVSDSTIRALIAGCTCLHALDVMDCPDVTCASYPSIIQHCPDILSILTASYQWLADSHGKASVFLALVTSEEARPLLQSSPFPIEVLDTCGSNVGLDRSAVSILRSRCMSDLRGVDASLEADVVVDELLVWIQQAHLLESLHLSSCVMFTDEALDQLSRICPHLKVLGLQDVLWVTSAAWMEGLARLAERPVETRELRFVNCPTITDEVLRKIVQVFPNLQRLQLQYTGVSLEAVESILWDGKENGWHGTTWYLPGEMVDALVRRMQERGMEGWREGTRLCTC